MRKVVSQRIGIWNQPAIVKPAIDVAAIVADSAIVADKLAAKLAVPKQAAPLPRQSVMVHTPAPRRNVCGNVGTTCEHDTIDQGADCGHGHDLPSDPWQLWIAADYDCTMPQIGGDKVKSPRGIHDATSPRLAAPTLLDPTTVQAAIDAIADRKRGRVNTDQLRLLVWQAKRLATQHRRDAFAGVYSLAADPRLPTWIATRNDAAIQAFADRIHSIRASVAEAVTLADDLAMALAEYDRTVPSNPDLSGAFARYRASKINLPHVAKLVKALQAAMAEHAAIVRTIPTSNRDAKRINTIRHARKRDVAAALAAVNAALDHAAECRLLSDRPLSDRPIGWQDRGNLPAMPANPPQGLPDRHTTQLAATLSRQTGDRVVVSVRPVAGDLSVVTEDSKPWHVC